MNNSGGISYLLKRGRLPTAPRGVPKYAVGGSTKTGLSDLKPGELRTMGPINAPLKYGTVPDYQFDPAENKFTPHYEYDKNGKLRYVPGVYNSGTYSIRTPATTPAAPVTYAPPSQNAEGPPGNDGVGGGTSSTPASGYDPNSYSGGLLGALMGNKSAVDAFTTPVDDRSTYSEKAQAERDAQEAADKLSRDARDARVETMQLKPPKTHAQKLHPKLHVKHQQAQQAVLPH
jgi:hypothetical protein